jgi:hypothetical protein
LGELAVDIHEWHEYWRDTYAAQERHYRRVWRLIVGGAVLVAFLNLLLLAYVRHAGK